MNKKSKKTFLEHLFSICVEASNNLSEGAPTWMLPIIRVPTFFILILLVILVGPIFLFLKLFRKATIDPFFKLRTELESKWYGGHQEEALKELREVKVTIGKNEQNLFFQGVKIPPYGKFKFDEFTKILWLLYHWEFHSGNFQEASEVCDYIIEKLSQTNTSERPQCEYLEEWVLNKARAIEKTMGTTAMQEYLLKFVNTTKPDCRINKFLHETRDV